MHVFLVQVDVIVGPLQGAEFQCLVLGNLGSFLGLCRVCCSVWLTLVVLTSDYQLTSVFWLWADLGRLWRIDVATTRRPKNIAGSCAWELSRLVEHHPSVFGGWATLCPVTLSALTLLLRAPRSTRHADTCATHRGAFRLMTVAHLQEMFNRLHQLQSWFADYSRWDVYNPFWKTHSPYAQQDEQLGQKHSEHFSSRAIQDFVTFFSVLWEQLLWTVEIISFLKRHFTCDFQRRI